MTTHVLSHTSPCTCNDNAFIEHAVVVSQDIARLIVERSTIMNSLFSKHSYRPESHAVLSALLTIFSTYIRRMRKTKEGEDLYSWVRTRTDVWLRVATFRRSRAVCNVCGCSRLPQSESQDQVFLRWTTGETATMHILVVHAMVILLTLGPAKGMERWHPSSTLSIELVTSAVTLWTSHWKHVCAFVHVFRGE